MNFSAPLNFQPSLNYPNLYYSPPNSFYQASDSFAASRHHPIENLYQPQDELYKQYYADEEASLAFDPIKKRKLSGNTEFEVMSSQGKLPNLNHRNETIKQINNASSVSNRFFNGLNKFDDRHVINQRQAPTRDLKLTPDQLRYLVQEANQEVNHSYNQNALQNLEKTYAAMCQASLGYNAQRESMANYAQMVAQKQAQSMEAQFHMLNNLQQQMNSQKAYEQMMINNSAMYQNPAYQNAQAMNALKLMQKEQQFAQNAQNVMRFEHEAQRRFSEALMVRNAQNQSLAIAQKQQAEAALAGDLSETHYDNELYAEETINSYQQPAKASAYDDLDDKKTAETSLSNPDEITFKEFYDPQPIDFQLFYDDSLDQIIQPSSKQSQNKKDEPLLSKRAFDYEEADQKSTTAGGRMSPKDKKVKRVNKVHVDQVQLNQSGSIHVADLTVNFSTTSSMKPMVKVGKPVVNVNKTKKEKKTGNAGSESKPAKKERKMNRLQSMRQAWENYNDEMKKPYVIQLHIDAEDMDPKVNQTPIGDAFQIEIQPTLTEKHAAQRRTKVIKTIWDASTIERERLDKFYVELKEIFGQEVTNEEAALKIVRGTGMDVDSTVDIIRRNAAYFRAIIFPEPKPVKNVRI